MRITNNYTQTSSPQFGNVIATDRAIAYLNKHIKPKHVAEANALIAEQAGRRPNIHLTLGSFVRPGSNTKMEYLRASVENEVFKEGIFTSPFGVLKEAANYANKLFVKRGAK